MIYSKVECRLHFITFHPFNNRAPSLITDSMNQIINDFTRAVIVTKIVVPILSQHTDKELLYQLKAKTMVINHTARKRMRCESRLETHSAFEMTLHN